MRVAAAAAAALVAGLAVAPDAARAQPVEGFYVGAGAGLNWLQEGRYANPNTTAVLVLFNFRWDPMSFRPGLGGVVSAGWGFGNGIRAEVELSYRENRVRRLRGFENSTIGSNIDYGNYTNPAGTALSYGVMINALYDFDIGWRLQPYLGVGAGLIWHQHDRIRARHPVFTGEEWISRGSDQRFAYQAIAGAALPIEEVPGLALTLEYRFLGTLEQTLRNEVRFTSSSATFQNGRATFTPFNHSVMFGIRYAFGVEAVTPVAAPEPARTFLVFFDWDRDNLTDRARQIIADAAANSRRVQSTRIEVSGHADRSGSPQYNQALSLRRANNVAAELVRLGVPRNEIVIQAFGESRPLVPTADGVREPQNRRVEIVLR